MKWHTGWAFHGVKRPTFDSLIAPREESPQENALNDWIDQPWRHPIRDEDS